MYVSLLFWAALAAPGYVLVRRIWSEDIESGLMGVLGLSYVAILALLSPISVLCYVLSAPLWIFSAACVAAMVAAVVEITRKGWWPDVGHLVVAAIGIELLVVVADVAIGGWTGAYLRGDTRVHVARIGALLGHGFENLDPFLATPHFFVIYHTNLLHSLYASCSQLTRVDDLGVWYVSLAWSKLLIASGTYYMAWSVFQRRWVAWVGCLFAIGLVAPITFLVYPNKVAAFWLVPMMIGFAVQACSSSRGWQVALKLACVSLLLGQVHGLYAIHAVIILAPLLAGLAIVRLIRVRPGRWASVACVAALAIGLVFPLVSKLHTLPTKGTSKGTAIAQKESQSGQAAKTPRALSPRSGVGGGGDLSWLLLAGGTACGLLGTRRRQTVAVLIITATAGVVLFVPPIHGILAEGCGRAWMVDRLGFALKLGFLLLVPCAFACLLESKTRYGLARSILSLSALLAAVSYAGNKERYTKYFETAGAPAAVRHDKLDRLRDFRSFLAEHIPLGETVLAQPELGMLAAMLYDCHLVAPARSSLGVPDMNKRRRNLNRMMAPKTPWRRRRELMQQYGITYFLPVSRQNVKWANGHVVDSWHSRGYRIAWLNTD